MTSGGAGGVGQVELLRETGARETAGREATISIRWQ